MMEDFRQLEALTSLALFNASPFGASLLLLVPPADTPTHDSEFAGLPVAMAASIAARRARVQDSARAITVTDCPPRCGRRISSPWG